MALDLGILIIPTPCGDAQPQQPADCQNYHIDARNCMEQECIDLRAIILVDEFHDFKYLPSKKALKLKVQRTECNPKSNQNDKTNKKPASGQSVSCVLGFTPTGVARALVITDEGSAETLKLVEEALGKHVLVAKNKTGRVYGTTHVEVVLKKYIKGEAKTLKESLSLEESSPWFYGEELAQRHNEDTCSISGREGLNELRNQFFRSSNGRRMFAAKKGYMVGEQLHNLFKQRVQTRMDELTANCQDLKKMQCVKNLCKRSGSQIINHKGFERGAPLFLFCLAVAIEKCALPKHMILASFCKSGFFDIKEASELFDINEALINDGCSQLDKTKKELGFPHTSLSKESQFTGSSDQLHQFANSAWKERALALQEERDNEEMLKLELCALDDMDAFQDAPEPEFEPREKTFSGALAKLSDAEPNSTNAANKDIFQQLFLLVFKGTECFKNKPLEVQKRLADLHLDLLKTHYLVLRKSPSPLVAGKTIHFYVWNILRKVKIMQPVKKDSLAKQCVREYNKYSARKGGTVPKTGEEMVDADGEKEIEPSNNM